MKSTVCFLAFFATQSLVWSAPTSLSDFVIFSGGAGAVDASNDTQIGGHTYINGNIGSNQDLFLQGYPQTGYPAQLSGSAYAGRDLTFGQNLTVGSSDALREVVANGVATIGGDVQIWGSLDAGSASLGLGATVSGTVTAPSSYTFSPITLPAPTIFTAGGLSQTVNSSLNELTLLPGTYGSLTTSRQNQVINLTSGDYFFDSITAQSGLTLNIDLRSGAPTNIYVVGKADFFTQYITLQVNGENTGGTNVPINLAPELASLVYLETYDDFILGGNAIWGGTVYASMGNINVGQYVDWTGAAYAYNDVVSADHGTWNMATAPEPSACLLLALGGVLGTGRRRRPLGE